MSKRPSRLLAWAYDAISGAVVEPPGGLSAAGWVKDTRPPAPYMNFLFNVAASWINFLRGPNIANWSRAAPITAFSDTTNIPKRMIAVDTVTHDGDTAAWRYAVVGNGTGGDPARQIWCSRRGDAWVRRTNLPVGVDGPLVGVAFVSASTGWVCWTTGGSGDGQIFFTAAGNSGAVGDDGVDWTASTLPGGAGDVVGVVGCNASRIAAIIADDILTSTDGAANFTAATLTGSFTGDGLDIVWSGQSFVALTSAEIFRSSNNVSATWARSTLPETSTRHRLATDGAGTVCVYAAGESTVQNLLVSTDHGATWDTIPGVAGMKAIKHIAYGDGVWIASSSVAPYLWQSNDLVKWVRLAPPVVESGNLAPLGAVYADARWLAVGNGFLLSTLRGVDPTPGAFVPNDDAPVVADAGYLRGRKVSTTAPTDTQTLAWNASTSTWEPTDAGGGSSATHGAGTLASRPTSPVAGDSYEVTSGLCTGDVFECFRDGIWTFVGRGITRRFALGQGFTLVSPGSNADAGTSVASYETGGVGRLALATAGSIHDATGCLIRRPIEPNNYGYRVSVRLMARGSFTGSSFAGLYVSNSAGTSIQFVASGRSTQNDEVIAGNWSSLQVPGVADAAPWDGATLLTLQIQGTAIQFGFARGSSWTRWSATLGFTPAYVGVCGLSDGPASNTYDFADFSLETFG